jgi:hypothetical protein
MKMFVDNDIAVKLAQWGLLTRFGLHLTKQGKAELFAVHTLKYKFKLAQPAKAAALLGSAAAAQELTVFTGMCQAAKGHSAQIASALAHVPSIDAGEAALFSAAAQYDAVLVDTGDKKALRALGRLGATHLVSKALAGKVACLEQTMHYLIGRWTYAHVSHAVLSMPSADAFAHKCIHGATEAKALSALHAESEELRLMCAGIIAKDPFGWIP